MSETGVAKFVCDHAAMELGEFPGFRELNEVRDKLRSLGFLGVDTSGIGFGNVSIRADTKNRFYISGSGTGAKPCLTPNDYSFVTAFDFAKNWLRCEGAIVASSESLTHAAIYTSAADVGAVLHCHSRKLWNALLDRAPTTAVHVEYGTPAMAEEVCQLFRTTEVRTRKLLVMAGHHDGIVSFGVNPSDVYDVLTAAIDRCG